MHGPSYVHVASRFDEQLACPSMVSGALPGGAVAYNTSLATYAEFRTKTLPAYTQQNEIFYVPQS